MADNHPYEAFEKLTKEVNALENGRSGYTAKPALTLLKNTTDYLVANADAKTGILKMDDKRAAEMMDIGFRTVFMDYLFRNGDAAKKQQLWDAQEDKDFLDHVIFKRGLGLDRKALTKGLKDQKYLSALTVEKYFKPFHVRMGTARTEHLSSKLEEKLASADDAKTFHEYVAKTVTDNAPAFESAKQEAAQNGINLELSKVADPTKDAAVWQFLAGHLPEDYSAVPKKAA
ncbi:MAG TPA: hypothetical protein VLJ21_00375 [Candidatus Binatia bacterium]|nr:hypothetical protein [Candidatus Binatia bacterium]